MIPLYGFLRGDTLGLLILAYENETIAALAEKLMRSASLRVAPLAHPRVVHRGRALDPSLEVRAAGFIALDRFDVTEDEVT